MTVDTQTAFDKFASIDWSDTPFDPVKLFSFGLSDEQRAWIGNNSTDPRARIADTMSAIITPFNQSATPEAIAGGWYLQTNTAMRDLLGPLFDAIREAA